MYEHCLETLAGLGYQPERTDVLTHDRLWRVVMRAPNPTLGIHATLLRPPSGDPCYLLVLKASESADWLNDSELERYVEHAAEAVTERYCTQWGADRAMARHVRASMH